MTIQRQPAFSQIVVNNIIPELDELLYASVHRHIMQLLEEIFEKHSMLNTTFPGAKYFYFQGKFYVSETITKYHIPQNVRPTFTVHHSLVEDMTKVVEYIEDDKLAEEKITIFNGIRRLARKSYNMAVLKKVISSSQHTDTMIGFGDRELSDAELELSTKLSAEFESINKLMQYRRTSNLLMY